MRFTHAAVAVAPLFLLLVSGSRAVAAQVPSDPCVQVTPAQVSAALGETVAAGQNSGTATCAWIANKPTHQVVSLMYSPPGDWDTRKRPMAGVTKSTVSGVGDDALALTMGTIATLFVKKGNTTIMVRAYGVSDPARQLAIEKTIAQAVLAKF
jgi:hypothetical protein